MPVRAVRPPEHRHVEHPAISAHEGVFAQALLAPAEAEAGQDGGGSETPLRAMKASNRSWQAFAISWRFSGVIGEGTPIAMSTGRTTG